MRLLVEISPHLKQKYDTGWVMKQVVFSLVPVVIASVVFFRLRAVLLVSVCIIGCLLSEVLVNRLRKRASTLSDYSAVVTGMLLAFLLPPKIPLWAAFLAAAVAILVGKQIFGGLGQNIFNPALVARAFLMAAFPVMLTSWVNPFNLEAVTQATPLALWKFSHQFVSLEKLFLGNVPGSLGETSSIAIILGGLYLILRGVACWRAPLGMFVGLSALSGIFYLKSPLNGSVFFHLFSGGAMLGMFFMVTDPVTTPVTKSGRFIFGLFVGILVVIIRKWAGLPEGVMYSILFMNAFVPLINKLTKPKSFGR
ncbi:MAG: RnfABCDGE type electron transport complex subunit D [Candidatus Omnitrophica bacterium]|nr:RnfABCDGE type electron transport complex subunit D [Candidatus Omnitrophota bacterium]